MSSAHLDLRTGCHLPLVGFGTSQMKDGDVEDTVEAALDAGYRHIDTAYVYLNEAAVGSGLRRWLEKTGHARDDVFVVTKLPPIGMHEGGVKRLLTKSLALLQLQYVDLYLVHMPTGMKGSDDREVNPRDENGRLCFDDSTDIISIWKQMEKVKYLGLTKNIGLSNFNIKQMKKIIANAKVPPSVLQVELNVYLQQPQLQAFCTQHNIALTAYAPFGSPGRWEEEQEMLLKNPVVALVATYHGVTPAQVLLRFLVQQGIAVIPKSSSPTRIKENMDLWGFRLSEVEMAALRALDKGEAGRRFTFRNYVGIVEHPEYPFA